MAEITIIANGGGFKFIYLDSKVKKMFLVVEHQVWMETDFSVSV